jgi:hypothetical protein
MKKYLRPHSPEWFDALDKSNPKQAAQTRQILSAVGREDVCSVCGDQPALDYTLASEQAAASDVSTLKLCADCLVIRRDVHRENFILLAIEHGDEEQEG